MIIPFRGSFSKDSYRPCRRYGRSRVVQIGIPQSSSRVLELKSPGPGAKPHGSKHLELAFIFLGGRD